VAPAAPAAGAAAVVAGTANASAASITAGEGSAALQASQQQSVAPVEQQPGDLFVFDQRQTLQKRSRSFSSMQSDIASAADAAVAASSTLAEASSTDMDWQQQQQQQLPRLAELCLFRVQVSYQALSALVQASGTQLSQLQLLQLTILRADAQPASAAASTRGPLQQQSPASSSSSSYLTTEQLVNLPVAWGCLQELHIHPYQLWGMLSAGCLVKQGTCATSATSSTPSSSSEDTAKPLRHLVQLLNLRHLYVVNAPISFAGASPPTPITPPGLAARIPSVGLPLHEPQAMRKLLTALQAGLQRLPALRQLLSYMGPVTPLVEVQVEDQDALGDVWMDAGEALLQALPAVRVREFRPSIHLPRSVQDAAAVQVVTLPQEPDVEFDAAADGSGTGALQLDQPASAAAAAAAAAVLMQQQQQSQQVLQQQHQRQAVIPAAAAAAAAGAGHVSMELEGPELAAAAAAEALPAPQADVQSTAEGASHQGTAWMEPEYMI
jgi:hypothetical protein